jgi:ABC-type Fe3+-hydroxamate transport system substrate-binding protein
MRVVSLVPSSTETLRAWGIDPIACTRYCEQPDLPTVGGTKNPDLDTIVALRPDLVVMDTTENLREHAEVLRDRGVAVLATDIHAVADVGPELRRLGDALGLPSAAGLTDEISEAIAATPGAEPTSGPRLRAFVPIWRRPWMTLSGRTYGSSVLAAIGVANVYADATDWFPTVTLDDVAGHSPDVVLAPTEPYEFRPPHLEELAAVAPVQVVDGRDLFWWGVRTPGALRRLRARLLS